MKNSFFDRVTALVTMKHPTTILQLVTSAFIHLAQILSQVNKNKEKQIIYAHKAFQIYDVQDFFTYCDAFNKKQKVWKDSFLRKKICTKL